MNIQAVNNYNNSFGSKVITTTSANNIMNNFSPRVKGSIKLLFAELENNGKNDVVFIDSTHHMNDLYMIVYRMIEGKLHQCKNPTVVDMTKDSFNMLYEYQSSSFSQVPVEKTSFDKHNLLLDIIKNTLQRK